ncbi:MAG TPA: arginine deiminase family protein [Gaiellaceae bacterium]|nr:arginine deiminase family protein [Gaiellaceae bacterium]
MTSTLRRVLVRPPAASALAAWRDYGWRAEPDAAGIAAEHEAFRAAIADAGAEVVVADPDPANPDAVYVFDPALVTPRGAVVLRPGKPGRRGEADLIARDLEAAGVPILARIEAPGEVEGGDTLWLDDRTLAVGLGYRTNETGAAQLRAALPGVDVLAYDLPHWHGREEILHLLSLFSPLAADLALVYLPLLPVRLVELMRSRGIAFVEVPGEEFDSMGCNVLALGPRHVLALEGNPETRRRLEAAGVEVRTYRGEELSRKGDGGPTCLTSPLARG